MKRVALIFPDLKSLSDFVQLYKLKQAEIDSASKKLTATMADWKIVSAITKFKAELNLQLPGIPPS